MDARPIDPPLSEAAMRRRTKRQQEQHIATALAPLQPANISFDRAVRIIAESGLAHIGSYHGSSHNRVSAPAAPTGMNERFVGFELELVPHLPDFLSPEPPSRISALQAFFGRMQELARKALPGYWTKVEYDSTVNSGAELISGYGPIAAHHAAMMPVLTDPAIARVATTDNAAATGWTQTSPAPGVASDARWRCHANDCLVCGDGELPAGVPDHVKLGRSRTAQGCGMHVHIHATDRLGRFLSESSRQDVAEVMADTIAHLQLLGSEQGGHAHSLAAALIGREPTEFCRSGAGGHYNAVNYEAGRTPTIEVRCFAATASPRLFFARLEFALALYEYALDACITGRGEGRMGQFLAWLDEAGGRLALPSVTPNLMMVISDYFVLSEELAEVGKPMSWLVDPEDDRSEVFRSEDADDEDEDDEDDDYDEDEDEDEDTDDESDFDRDDDYYDEGIEDEGPLYTPDIERVFAEARAQREAEIDALAASENIDSEQAAELVADQPITITDPGNYAVVNGISSVRVEHRADGSSELYYRIPVSS